MKTIMTPITVLLMLTAIDLHADEAVSLENAKALLGSEEPAAQEKGFQMMKTLAESGGSEAALGVGLMYSRGTGVGKNRAEAIKWYQKAAAAGNTRAQYLLSVTYRNGCHGTKRDIKKGEELLKKARSAATDAEKQQFETLEKTKGAENACNINQFPKIEAAAPTKANAGKEK